MGEQYLAEISSFKALTLSIFELTIKLIAPEDIQFTAGQCLQLQIDGKQKVVGIVSLPLDVQTHLIITFDVSKEESNLRTFVDNLTIGQQIKLTGPVGGFKEVDFKKPLMVVAQGVGIAPLVSFLNSAFINNPSAEIKLLFEVNSEDDVFYFNRFNKLAFNHSNFKFLPLLVRPHSHWPGEVGRIVTYLDISAEYYRDSEVICCGKKDFVEEVSKKLQQRGFKPEQVNCQEL